MGETSPVHPYKDVRVVGDPQLLQEGNIPERQTMSYTSVIVTDSFILTHSCITMCGDQC